MQPVWHFVNGVPTVGPLTIGTAAVTSTVPGLWPNGTAGAPSQSFSGAPTFGAFFSSSFGYAISASGAAQIGWGSTGTTLINALQFTSALGTIGDVSLSRGAANQLKLADGDQLVLGEGSAALPSLGNSANIDTGINFSGSGIYSSVDAAYYTGLFADQFQLKATSTLDWSSGNVGAASDVSLSRGAANRLDLATGDVFTSEVVTHRVLTFATLPATPVAGMTCYISDSTTATWGATITGGGANNVIGFFNGTNWTVMGA